MLELTLNEILLRLGFALIVGGLIGAERQYREKAAGLRTMTLICLGATLFTMFSQMFSETRGDPGRVAAGVVSGIGFLGAGVILRDRGQVVGLTTAATIWLVAALGMGIGLGQFAIAGVAGVVSIAVLWIFPRLEFFTVGRANVIHTYEVALAPGTQIAAVRTLSEEAGLKIAAQTIAKKDGKIVCSWRAVGRNPHHAQLMRVLLEDARVLDFEIRV